MDQPAAIHAHDFGYRYAGSSSAALAGVDLDVPAGACLLVVGPSGSGKSTFGLALSGLIPREIPGHWTGSLTVDGVETRSFDPGALAARVGLVFQDPSRQIVMDRVGDDTAFGLENRAWTPAEMHRRVPEALTAVGLAGQDRRFARALSGGQQQRLALAGVLAARPGVLVLDEPTANLDPGGVAAFDARLREIRTARTTTIVLVEHRAAVAWPAADLVLALGRDGRPIAAGPPTDILSRHRDRLVTEGIWLPDSDRPRPGRRFDGGSGTDTGSGTDDVLRATGVVYGYAREAPVIRGIDLVVRRGERLALVGPNGGGKSTLARLLVGLLRPDMGAVRLLGRDPSRSPGPEFADLVGFVFQEPERQFLTNRVRDEIELGLDAERVTGAEAFMDRIGLPLTRFGDRSPYRLSGGEQRRLSLATALIRRPRVLVLDEPTFGQDRHGYETLLAILHEHIADGTSLVLATHDEHLVAEVADRVVRLEDGLLSEDGR